MVINDRYSGIHLLYTKWKNVLQEPTRLLFTPKLFYQIKKLKEENGFFSSVEIETLNRCNGNCSFCPVSRNNDTRPYAKMEDGLFQSIILQLKDLNYRGKIALFSNNEPFLDVRIVDFIKYTREHLPKAFLYLYTNGTIVTVEKILEIVPYLNRLVIDNYNDELKLNPTSVEINNLCLKDEELNNKIIIHLRKENEVLTSRGGQHQTRRYRDLPCSLVCCLSIS